MTVLDDILCRKREDLVAAKRARPLAKLRRELSRALPVRDFSAALFHPGEVALIAELKRMSPSAGLLRPRYSVRAMAQAYAAGGARALSILTEEHFFGGRLVHLAQAKRAAGLPVLRKDFLFDPYHLYEARCAGADAVLLIAAHLTRDRLKSLIQLARRLGMTPLVEVHDEVQLRAAAWAGAGVIGVNSRNLSDLSVHPRLFGRLVPLIPRDRLAIAESGIRTPEDVARLKRLRVNAMLVGESLLKQSNLETAARALVRAGEGR